MLRDSSMGYLYSNMIFLLQHGFPAKLPFSPHSSPVWIRWEVERKVEAPSLTVSEVKTHYSSLRPAFWTEAMLSGVFALTQSPFAFLLSVLRRAVSCGLLSQAKASKLDAAWSAERPLGHCMVCNESETCWGIDSHLGHIKMNKQSPLWLPVPFS